MLNDFNFEVIYIFYCNRFLLLQKLILFCVMDLILKILFYRLRFYCGYRFLDGLWI